MIKMSRKVRMVDFSTNFHKFDHLSWKSLARSTSLMIVCILFWGRIRIKQKFQLVWMFAKLATILEPICQILPCAKISETFDKVWHPFAHSMNRVTLTKCCQQGTLTFQHNDWVTVSTFSKVSQEWVSDSQPVHLLNLVSKFYQVLSITWNPATL